jgi:hypothetical protein
MQQKRAMDRGYRTLALVLQFRRANTSARYGLREMDRRSWWAMRPALNNL